MSFDGKVTKVDPSQLPLEAINRVDRPKTDSDDAFGSVLRAQVTGLKFSAHAEERIRRRGIELSVGELERLRDAVARAAGKGSKDSLVLVNDKAFLVSVTNRTVITALSGSSVKEGVFTNIDSAVVV